MLGHLQLLEKLGEGAFGAVWKALDRRLDRTVAAKIPRRRELEPEEVEKFLREARAAAQLQHPNIVGVHEAGQQGETIYIVSDFIDGSTLAEWLQKHRPTERQSAELCRKIALALDYAHGHGVVHRDLKPANVMMDRSDEPHIMDFGLAKRESGETTKTVEGSILGTPAYMSPEQARGEDHGADGRSDVYSLGVMLFEMLTGERPFRGEPTLARPVSRWERAWRWCKRNPVVAALSFAAALLVCTVAIVSTAAYFREAMLKTLAVEKTAQALRAEASAEQQKQKAEEEALRATKSEQDSQQSLYYSNIALAQRYLQEGEIEGAGRVLDRCPVQYRRWEWSFLNRALWRGQRTILWNTPATSLAFSPDGRRLAIGTAAGELILWDDAARRILFRKAAHAKAIGGLAFRPDGGQVATGSEDGAARAWTMPGGEMALELRGHTAALTPGLAFARDGKQIATASTDNSVRIWDAASGRQQRMLSCSAVPLDLAWQAGGAGLFVLEKGVGISRWDTSSAQRSLFLADKHAKGMDYLADRNLLALAYNGSFDVWNVGAGKPERLFRQGGSDFGKVSLGADGQVVAAKGYAVALMVFDIKLGKPLYHFADSYGCFAMSPDGARCALVRANKDVAICPTRLQMESFSVRAGVVAGAREGLGAGTLVSTADAVYETDRATKLLSIGGQTSPDERRLLHLTEGGVLQTFDLTTGFMVSEVPLPVSSKARPRTAISPDQQYIAVRDDAGYIRIFSTDRNQEVAKIEIAEKDRWGRSLALHDDLLAAEIDGGCVRPWNWRTGRSPGDFGAHAIENRYGVTSIVFSPVGDCLATAGGRVDRTIRVWHWPDRKLLCVLRGHGNEIRSLAFSHDGSRLVSASSDETVRIWAPASGQEILQINGNAESVAFTRDDAAIMAGNGGSGVQVLEGGIPATRPPGQPIDLLPWLRQQAETRASGNGPSPAAVRLRSSRHTIFPVAVAPAGSYVLRGKLTRTRSGKLKTIGFLLPAGKSKTMLAFDHESNATSGLDGIEKYGVGETNGENPTDCPVTLADGQSYTFEARVELQADQAEVTVALDGRRIIHWQGPQSALMIWPHWNVPGRIGLTLGDVDVTVEQLELLAPQGADCLAEPLPTLERAAPPSGATVVAAPRTIDLLPLLDLERGVFDATARRSESGLEVSSEKSGRVMVPVWPRGDYELSGSFTLPETGSPVILIPTKEARGLVHWRYGGASALELLQGKSAADPTNPTRVSPSKVEVGRRHAFRVRVVCEAGEADLAVQLDGEPYMHWKGPELAIALWHDWEVPHQRTLGVGVRHGRVTFHELALKMLNGEAWILRSATAPAAQGAALCQRGFPNG